jgi:hypothetical protein
VLSKKNNTTGIDIDAEFTHIFEDKTLSIKNSKFVLNTVYQNKPFSTELRFFKDGSVAYGFSNIKNTLFDASDVSAMIGIKASLPACANVIADEFASGEPTATVDVSGSPTPSDGVTVQVPDMITATPTVAPTKAYTVSDLARWGEKLKLKGNKEVNGVDVYVLKGAMSNNEIINDINRVIETNIYNFPMQIGNLYYDLYVNRETYEIVGMDIDISEIVKTLSGSTEDVENIVNVVVMPNTISALEEIPVKKAGLNNFSNVWTVIQYYTNLINALKK